MKGKAKNRPGGDPEVAGQGETKGFESMNYSTQTADAAMDGALAANPGR